MPLAVGELVARRYEVQALVAAGPLDTLYRARDREIGVEVALRVIGPRLLPDEAARQVLLGKLMRARAFSHANLMRVFGVLPIADEVVVAAQWVPGQSLAEHLRARPLTTTEAKPLVAQIAAALTHAHQLGIVLGDLHPASVILVGGAVKVENVGIAAALPRTRFLEAIRDTPGYARLAPELRAGGEVDVRADVYSLGLLTAELLTGTPPPSAAAIGRPEMVPAPLQAVLARALAVKPAERHASVEALANELDAVLGGQAPVPPRVRRPTPAVPLPFAARSDERSTPREPTETTRELHQEELAALQKEHEETRRVSEEELFPLRVQSSGTNTDQIADVEVIEEADAHPSEELMLEARPSVVSEANESEEVPSPWRGRPPLAVSSDEEQTTRELLLHAAPLGAGGPLRAIEDTDAADTMKIPKMSMQQLDVAPTSREVPARALPPPGKTPPPPSKAPPSRPSPSPMDLLPLASSQEVPTRVDRILPDAPKIEVRGLPVEQLQQSPLPPRPAPPRVEPPLYGDDDDDLPTQSSVYPSGHPTPPVSENVPRPIGDGPSAAGGNNVPIAISAHGSTDQLPGRRRRRNPFEAPPTDGSNGLTEPPRAQGTMLLSIDRRRSHLLLMLITVGLALTIGGLAVWRYLEGARIARDRLAKQRLADELNARAETLRNNPPPASASTTPVVTHPEPPPALLPRVGPCPLGANLVSSGSRSYCIDVYEYPGGKAVPRVNVSFVEAERICQSRGERLCSDTEWERGCRGKGAASYPYGQAFDPIRCNAQHKSGEIVPAGSSIGCRSASGAYDMSGNVAEWVASGFIRGGSVALSAQQVRCSAAVRPTTRDGSSQVGFRCCADPVPAHK